MPYNYYYKSSYGFLMTQKLMTLKVC